MEFTKQEFAAFRQEAEKALKGLEDKFKVKIRCGNIKYDTNTFKLTLDVTKDGVDVQKEEFETYCTWFGFKPEDYGREFVMDGVTYRIVGFRLSAKVNNALIQAVDTEKKYSTTVSNVKACMHYEEGANV